MEAILGINSSHLAVLRPLVKWRILDQQALFKDAKWQGSYRGFQRAVSRLELFKLLESTHLVGSNKKYVYLTELGEKLVNEDQPAQVKRAYLSSYALMSDIFRELIQVPNFKDFKFEHQIEGFRVSPDGIIYGTKKKLNYSLGVEFILDRKDYYGVETKAKALLSSSCCDYILYFFLAESFKESYEKFLLKQLGQMAREQMMFFLIDREKPLLEYKGSFKEEGKIFKEIFF